MKLALYFAIFLHLYNLSVSICWPNFYFYSSKESRHIYNLTTTGSLKHTGYDRNLPTIFVVHGFGSSGLAPRIRRMKSAFHRYTQVNTIAVDWKEGATAFKDPIYRAVYYIRAIINLRAVGQAVSTFVQSNEIDPSLITCVGHSLGAHGCGFAAKEYFAETNNKFGRIVGLDPAGPLFQFFSIVIPSQLRLDSSDASFVDCIYTSTYNGIVQPICHANFYPNALRGQPHCIGDDKACLHEAAVSYFIESIQPPNTQCSFIANQCDFFRFDCNLLFSAVNVKSQMGYYASEFSHARGLFVLNTNSTLPYCLK